MRPSVSAARYWRTRPGRPHLSAGSSRGDSAESRGSRIRGQPSRRQGHSKSWGADMAIAGTTILITGANRGIGQALVNEALERGAARVYAGTRQPLAHSDGRVTPLNLDVTNAAQIQAAADQVSSLDILINNAGIFLLDDLSDPA